MHKQAIAVAGALAIAVNFAVCNSLRVREEQVVFEFRHENAEVYEVDSDCVVFCDREGELWAAEVDDANVFQVGDKYTLIFNDLGTPNIYDDEVVGIF